MNRRELIKKLACSTAACSLLNTGLNARAYAEKSDRYWVFVTAFGGWDATLQWDPKGKELGPISRYSEADIRTAGNIRYAPLPEDMTANDRLDAFTQKHYQKMLVINGVDQGTNNHAVGRQIAMVGTDARGMPAMGAFFASPYAPNQSMPFIVSGGYSNTAGLMAESRLLNRDGYNQLLNPDRFLDSDAIYERLLQHKKAQLSSLQNSAKTGADVRALSKLATARNGSGGVAELLERIPGEIHDDPQFAATEVGAAGFASGATTSLSISIGEINGMGGFDSHVDNDAGQLYWLEQLLNLLEHLIQQLTIQDVLAKTTIVVNSDFGRLPYYNNNNGKDHWPIGNMMLMGAGIEGNRIIGGTDDKLNAKRFNPITLVEDENGMTLTPSAIYASLRRIAGMEGSDLDARFPLNAPYMKVFD